MGGEERVFEERVFEEMVFEGQVFFYWTFGESRCIEGENRRKNKAGCGMAAG